MKRLFIACSILLLLFGLSVYVGARVETLTSSYIQQLTTAKELAAQEDWSQASAITRQVYQDWTEQAFFLHALLRHSDTDQILLSFRAVEQYLSLEEMDEYAAANASLITQLELLAEMEQATAENVL